MESKLISKNSIFNMNNTLNTDTYEEDYKIIIKEKDLVRMPFLHKSSQLMYRSYIIEHLKNYASCMSLSYCCLHLAVYIMDIFMDNHLILPERLHLVANVCLLISAKFEEVSIKIPKLEELNAGINNRYTIMEYKTVELVILQFFRWYIMFPTAAHYTHYFMQAIISAEDPCDNMQTVRNLIFQLHEHITNCLEKVIDDVHFMQLFTPSRLAAAIISVARRKVGLNDWTEKLEHFTEYSKEQIYEPVHALLQSSTFHCSNC